MRVAVQRYSGGGFAQRWHFPGNLFPRFFTCHVLCSQFTKKKSHFLVPREKGSLNPSKKYLDRGGARVFHIQRSWPFFISRSPFLGKIISRTRSQPFLFFVHVQYTVLESLYFTFSVLSHLYFAYLVLWALRALIPCTSFSWIFILRTSFWPKFISRTPFSDLPLSPL